MKKIIFLDFDGVMDTAYYDHYLVSKGLPETDDYGVVFDPECVECLRRIVDETDACIVVTSTWKDFMSMGDLLDMWEARGMPGELIDFTPSISRHRGNEIDAWLKECDEPCSYVIIDDMPFSEFNIHQRNRFLMVNAFHGLDDDAADKAITILNNTDADGLPDTRDVLIIPDTHGRSFWRKAQEMVDYYDQIVFLGDYLDPYEQECIPQERVIEDFLDIISFKESYPQKVVLLLGNHDLHYWWDNDVECSRRDMQHLGILHRLFMMHRRCFQMAYTLKSTEKEYLFTHAGVLTGWIEDNRKLLKSIVPEYIVEMSCNDIALYLNSLMNATGFGLLGQVSYYRGGYDSYGSPVWADVREHEAANTQFPFYQIFGHTQQQAQTITDEWACLDCRKMFSLSLATDKLDEVS